ncbi:ATP-binding cassette domain-containing protein [Dactylosporangium sp. NPDC000555]|uniref:ATP-binding cassette domain-containing protein n=1 Tax=Dactylosporangium sp. NPDC000555 TaxID=3154260 RepID=UPI00333250FA
MIRRGWEAARRALTAVWWSLPAAVLAAFVLAGAAGPILTAGRERQTDLNRALLAPGAGAWLGTDHLGRDELVRLVAGARGSLIAVGVVLVVCLVLGGGLGVAAGWWGGLFDRFMLRVVDVVTSVPTLLLGLVLAGLLGGGPWQVALALGATLWPPYVRVIRTETRLRRDAPSNQALLLLGARPPRILLRHVLPALGGPVTVLLGITAAEVIVGVATLSFLGLGARPPAPEWGSMLVESRPYLSSAPWLFLAPAVAVAVVAVACNLLADRLGTWFTHGVRAGAVTRPARAVRPATRPTVADVPAEARLQVTGLSVDLYDGDGYTRVVDGVTLSVPAGGTLAIVGASGSGKTMTALAMLDLFPAQVSARVTGSVRLAGRELVGLDEQALRRVRGRTVAYIPQDVGGALHPLRRVGAQVADVVVLHRGLRRRAAERRALELLALVGIDDPARVARQRPGALSGGMRQRVLLAAALAGEPPLLVADEPTSSLDATAAVALVELFGEIRNRLNTSLVIITHELGVAARLADTLAVFDQGRVVETGDTHAVLRAPRHPVTRRLIAAADLPPPRADRDTGDAPVLLTARDLRLVHPAHARRPAVPALAGADLTVYRGEVVGLVGNSGCGKSTLARSLAGLEPRLRGTVELDGRPVDHRHQRVHLVFQDPTAALNRRQSIGGALAEALHLHGVRASDLPARRTALLRRVGLTADHGRRRPWQLSGGERQRAVIARALAGDPDLLILDEPVSALDCVHRADVINLLRSLRDDGLAMVVISHDLGVVEHVADRIAVMHSGRIVDELRPGAMATTARHRISRELVAARDFFRMDTVNRPVSLPKGPST